MMFESGGDHFHQFISSSTTTSSSQAHQNPFDNNIYPPPHPTTNLDHHPWYNNELLSLFKITSSLDNWFPSFTSITCQMEEEYQMKHDSKPPCDPHEENGQTTQATKRKKKRGPSISPSITTKGKKRFEMFKSLCEDIVNKMMSQQEDMLNKLLQDMIRGDEEKLVKQVAWKKQEMAWINKELDIRAHHQAIASERHASLTHYLKLFTSTSIPQNSTDFNAQNNNQIESSSSSHGNGNSTSSTVVAVGVGKEEIGKRWPRDEVMALIKIRCNYLNNSEQQDKEGPLNLMKAPLPLWEKISQGMMELGYKRSSKRCKEKWENINKYFRKTKDISKKRSVDSRTCPYFHQLTTFYNKGRIILSQGLQDESDKHLDSLLLNQNQDFFD